MECILKIGIRFYSKTELFEEMIMLMSVTFKSPLVSFLYERGWRQSFNQSGFPGPDEEVCVPWFVSRNSNTPVRHESLIKRISKD